MSRFPYDWPYSINVHEETGVYLQFIHTSHNPIQSAQCIHGDVHFASVNDDREWIHTRPWTYWLRNPDDNVAIMYKCAKHILTLLSYDSELQFLSAVLNSMSQKNVFIAIHMNNGYRCIIPGLNLFAQHNARMNSLDMKLSGLEDLSNICGKLFLDFIQRMHWNQHRILPLIDVNGFVHRAKDRHAHIRLDDFLVCSINS
jgi:hypothetical protein